MIEIIRPLTAAAAPRAVIFDFDGTVSTIRSGWMRLMAGMMVETLAATGTTESAAELTRLVEDFVWRLTGGDTRLQIAELAIEVERRGGAPVDVPEYMRRFVARLDETAGRRVAELRSGACPPDRYLVPGTRAMLEALAARGVRLYLASGTDEDRVLEEAALLDVARYFDGGIRGARPGFPNTIKRDLVERILAGPGMRGSALAGFGDGYVETSEVKRAGGVAVGLATGEPLCESVDPWKRLRLIEAGADVIVPNFRDPQRLLETLFSHHAS